MKRWSSAFGYIAVGMILLTQFCTLLFISSAVLAWAALKSTWQRKRSIRYFRKELKRQGVPEELIERMIKRYGKTVDWLGLLKSRKRHL